MEENTEQIRHTDVEASLAHPHAQSRLLLGLGAVAVLIMVSVFVWMRWGDTIIEVCGGDSEACVVELPPADAGSEATVPAPDPTVFQ